MSEHEVVDKPETYEIQQELTEQSTSLYEMQSNHKNIDKTRAGDNEILECDKRIADEKLLKILINSKGGNNFNLVLDKYPGKLHIYFYSIEKLASHSTNLISLSVEVNGTVFNSNKFPVKAFIKPDLYVTIPITKKIENNLEIKVTVSTYMMFDSFTSKNSPYNSTLEFRNNEMNKLQNSFLEEKLCLRPVKSFFEKAYISLFSKTSVTYPICRCYCSYIPDTDTNIFNTNPNSLVSLSKWVLFRREAFTLMYEGFINIKCEKYSYFWQSKIIKWYGFVIFIIDPSSNTLEERMDLSNEESSIEILSKRIIKFNISGKLVEIECLDNDSFRKCTEALYALFPKIFNLI